MKTVYVIAGAAALAAGGYIAYRLWKKSHEKEKKPVNTTTNLQAKVRETTQSVIDELKKPVYSTPFPPQISKEFSLNRVIDAKTLIITNEIPRKTPITMNDMVLRDKQVNYVKVITSNEF